MNADNKRIFDVLVIGTGISGLSTAISAAKAGLKVAVLSKDPDPAESNTRYAQGGIVFQGYDDSPDLLARDIMAAGDNLNNVDAVSFVAQNGPRAVREFLVEYAGIPFVAKPDGTWDLTREAAHSTRRILHVNDASGLAIENGLLDLARSLDGITWLLGFVALDIITNTHNSRNSQERYREPVALGAYVYDKAGDQVVPVFAAAVVLATGGLGNLFLHTSNSPGATGDGVAMASRVGCEIINAEYVQFHPTLLFHRDKRRFLITEALRGEGARLRNRSGELFMQRYLPEQLELAPRDEVARAIYREMALDGAGYVYLDARDLSVDVSLRFPTIYKTCQTLGIAMERDLIPVVPAAHYFCGGIKTDLSGRTAVRNLYAVGENACNGVHGANRLASVSLLESLTFGLSSAQSIIAQHENLPHDLVASIPDWEYPAEEEDFDDVLIKNDLHSLQTTMWNYVGIIRTPKRIKRALADLNYLSHRVESFYKEARITRELAELRNAVLSATIIARAASRNPHSCGCHFVEHQELT